MLLAFGMLLRTGCSDAIATSREGVKSHPWVLKTKAPPRKQTAPRKSLQQRLNGLSLRFRPESGNALAHVLLPAAGEQDSAGIGAHRVGRSEPRRPGCRYPSSPAAACRSFASPAALAKGHNLPDR